MHNDTAVAGERWQALDIIKTIGLLGVLSAHVIILWFGKKISLAGFALYDMSAVPWWIVAAHMVVVHLLFVAAGAATYFYLKQRKPGLYQIGRRMALMIFLGVIFGLNIHPPMLFWNIFLFYAVSILVIFIVDRYWNEKGVFLVSLVVLLGTPAARAIADALFPGNYLAGVLAGNSGHITSFYPFFPWFFLTGAGYLASYWYSRYGKKRFQAAGLLGGTCAILAAAPFLRPLNFDDVFGSTSRLPLSYLVLIFGLFIFLISLAQRLSGKEKLSPYNPLVAAGTYILPVYLLSLLAILIVYGVAAKQDLYGGGVGAFLALELFAVVVAYVSGITFARKAERRKRT